jgi:biopolymer transport protein ExbD
MKIHGARGIQYDSGPNMTPLVDIVMVILIFLMLTGTFAGAEHFLTSNLAFHKTGVGGVQASSIPDEDLLQVRVSENAARDGFVAVAGQYQASDKASLAAALRKLRDGYRAANTKLADVQIVIAPSRTVRYKHVIEVFEAAQMADFTKIGFAPPQ